MIDLGNGHGQTGACLSSSMVGDEVTISSVSDLLLVLSSREPALLLNGTLFGLEDLSCRHSLDPQGQRHWRTNLDKICLFASDSPSHRQTTALGHADLPTRLYDLHFGSADDCPEDSGEVVEACRSRGSCQTCR